MDDSIKLTSSYIEAMAPNPRTLATARGIVDRFSDTQVSDSGTRLYARCLSKSDNAYVVSARLDGVLKYSCTCPSRQSPCKHVLALLMLYESAPEAFLHCSADIHRTGFESAEQLVMDMPSFTSLKADKSRNALRLKGLHTALGLCGELIGAGIGQTSLLPELLEKSSILLTFKLPDVYSRWCEIIYPLLGDDSDNRVDALDKLSGYCSALKCAAEYCSARDRNAEYPVNYKIESWLGASWTFSQLEAMGNVTENARLLQLSFSVLDNTPAKRVEETGLWADLNTGVIVRTINLRPYSALARTKELDSFHDVLLASTLLHYPLNNRVRWKSFTCAKPVESDYLCLSGFASENSGDILKSIKRKMLDPFEDFPPVALVKFKSVLSDGDRLFLTGGAHESICLKSGGACDVMRLLPLDRFDSALLEFHFQDGHISASPLCLVGTQGLFRL